MFNNSDLRNVIKSVLKNRTPKSINNMGPGTIHSAVLIPLFKDKDEFKVLFTKRSKNVEHHKGQMSFPGGVVEEHDDSFMDTALRETNEEIGLVRRDVTILGQIDDRLTLVSNFIIHPFVGLFPHPYDFEINHEEVAGLVMVPFKFLTSSNSEENIKDTEYGGKIYSGPVFKYNGEVIWGATAGIIKNFIEIISPRINLS